MSNVQKSQQGILVDMKHSFDMIEGYLYSLLGNSNEIKYSYHCARIMRTEKCVYTFAMWRRQVCRQQH